MNTSPPRPRLLVDIVSDPVCPWCYVGLKSFQVARDRLADRFQILPRVRAFMLNPDTPAEGIDREAYYQKKFPDARQREEIALKLKAAAMGAGFKMDPSIPERLPNTAKAHQVIRLAHFNGAQERIASLIYAAYWDEGLDIGDEIILVDLAIKAGLNKENVEQDLRSPRSKNEILAEAEAFRQAGVSAAPTYIVNERDGFTGALPPEKIAAALIEASQQGGAT